MSSLDERVIAIIAEQLRVPVEDVKPTSHLVDDLKADSLDIVDLSIALEEEFSSDGTELEISEEDAAGMQTVQDIVGYLTARGVPIAHPRGGPHPVLPGSATVPLQRILASSVGEPETATSRLGAEALHLSEGRIMLNRARGQRGRPGCGAGGADDRRERR